MSKEKKKQFRTPTGMHDILPNEQYIWQYFWRMAEDTAGFYNYERIDTPMIEQTELFEKGTGQGTDIVQKEMFSFKTKGGDSLTLRPEGTPSVARAFIQNGMRKWTSPVKVYYGGPMFRHEKPQRGRFRQFYQFGLETIGEEDAARDAEIINTTFKILERLRLTQVCMEINSIGCKACRPRYIKALKNYYRYRLKQVCADCRERYKSSPLRLLDCDQEKCQRVKTEAPQIVDDLCNDCNEHFKEVLEILDFVNIPYILNPHLVRGLDYYTRTVFEIFLGDVTETPSISEGGDTPKRLAIASGGRYDNLVKFLGGNDAPAVGVAMGVERIIEAMKANDKLPKKPQGPRVFVVQLGDRAKKRAFLLFEEFRKEGIAAREALGRDSISAQLKLANKYKADLAIIIGQKEVLDKVAIIREMDTGTQETIPEEKLIKEIKKRLSKKR
ncbi:MAG: histidine--tRNA ligase [Candidatus Spechtbacterales bacterium]